MEVSKIVEELRSVVGSSRSVVETREMEEKLGRELLELTLRPDCRLLAASSINTAGEAVQRSLMRSSSALPLLRSWWDAMGSGDALESGIFTQIFHDFCFYHFGKINRSYADTQTAHWVWSYLILPVVDVARPRNKNWLHFFRAFETVYMHVFGQDVHWSLTGASSHAKTKATTRGLVGILRDDPSFHRNGYERTYPEE